MKISNMFGKICCQKNDRVNTRGYDEIYTVDFNWDQGKFSPEIQTVYDKLRQSRLCHEAIAGIMGNIHVESAFSADAERRLGRTGAVGIIQWTGQRAEKLKKTYPGNWNKLEAQVDFLLAEFDKDSPNADPDGVAFYSLALKDSQRSPVYYSDLFQALVERNVNRDHYMEEVTVNTAKGPVLVRGRLSKEANQYDGRYYLDADRRRNYARIYADCIARFG